MAMRPLLGFRAVAHSGKHAVSEAQRTQSLHLFRHLLRMGSKFPDPLGAWYVHVRTVERFRRHMACTSTRKIHSLLQEGRKQKRLLQRAVDAKHLPSMERILQLAYGCRGRLRHVLERQRDADHKPVPLLHAFPRRWEAARRSAAFPAQAMNPVVALPQLRQPENPSPDSLPLDQVHKWTRRECRQRIPPSLFYKALLIRARMLPRQHRRMYSRLFVSAKVVETPTIANHNGRLVKTGARRIFDAADYQRDFASAREPSWQSPFSDSTTTVSEQMVRGGWAALRHIPPCRPAAPARQQGDGVRGRRE